MVFLKMLIPTIIIFQSLFLRLELLECQFQSKMVIIKVTINWISISRVIERIRFVWNGGSNFCVTKFKYNITDINKFHCFCFSILSVEKQKRCTLFQAEFFQTWMKLRGVLIINEFLRSYFSIPGWIDKF